MVKSILSIVALLLPFVIDLLDGKKPYAKKQKVREAINSGDTDSIGIELDKLREKYRRRIAGNQQDPRN
jgi:hypothetical protein